ncbi:hypothetical protein [Endozoicomonas sp. 4G]|uniref:hypothetical protein n=1 Tax=Endozoicomonas sp. 4G TaxID=2872754 RepID=UPI00207911AD|nr:hypothetical protein [Endozoicomonas sp. 4G]
MPDLNPPPQPTFQDSIGLKLDEEESLVLVPSEFPAVAKVSDMADENWPQLIAAESVDTDASGIRSVFRWADQWQLNAFPDDPLLRFLAFIHGAAFCVQDNNNGQLSYIVQHNGKLLSISRYEAYLRFSLYSQSFLESLYPEIFGPSLPAGGGWHEWNRFIRKQPFHPYERPANSKRAVDLSSREVTDLKTPSRPYLYTSKRYKKCCADNSPRSHYFATYANLPSVKPETVRIGNQDLITLDTSQSFINPDLAKGKDYLEMYNFKFLADFLSKNNEIKYIVDIGCGDAKISLLLQNYLNERNLKIKVIPVDVSNAYDDYPVGVSPLPINLIPAQEIVGATPATTLFIAIHPFTDKGAPANRLIYEVVKGKIDYYLTTLLKNNPGCFVLATEDFYCSAPHHYIPPEMVYSKHYYAYANSFTNEDRETEPRRKAEAAKLSAGKSDLYRLNQLLAKLPENRQEYLTWIPRMTKTLQKDFPKEPTRLWPDNIFQLYLQQRTCIKRIKSCFEIQSDLLKKELEPRCWHIYRQDAGAVDTQAGLH